MDIRFCKLYFYIEGQAIEIREESELPYPIYVEYWGEPCKGYGALWMYFKDTKDQADVSVEFIDPDGNSRGKSTKTLKADQTWSTEYVSFDKVGIWKLKGTLNGITKTWSAVNVLPVSPPPGGDANLTGYVHDEKGALSGVSVSLNGYRTETAEDGKFSISSIPHGNYTIICTKEGYYQFSKNITLNTGNNSIDIQMSRIIAEGNGRIYACLLDVDGDIYKDDDFPVQIPLQSQIRAHFDYQNTGEVQTLFHDWIEIIDPDRVQRAYAYGYYTLDPGWTTASARTHYITVDKAGEWQIHAKLKIGEAIVDEKTWTAVNVGGGGGGGGGAANLSGVVQDTAKKPIPAASIKLNSYITATKLDGTFSISGIVPGNYKIQCRKAGYQEYSKSITIKEGNNSITITMLAEGETPKWWEKLEWWQWAAIAGGVAATIAGVIGLSREKKSSKT